MFDRLLAWYVMYTLSGFLAPWRNFATCKVHFVSIYDHRTSFSGYIFATKASIDNRKKADKQQYLLYTSC